MPKKWLVLFTNGDVVCQMEVNEQDVQKFLKKCTKKTKKIDLTEQVVNETIVN